MSKWLPPTLIKSDPSIYLGPRPDLVDSVPAAAIVSLCPTPFGSDLLFEMVDRMSPRRVPERRRFEAFLAEAEVLTRAGPTYWHCHRGINRSGFALAAFLHLYRRQRISAAIARLRRLRSPLVLQNVVFERTLREWYGEPSERAFDPVDVAHMSNVAVPTQARSTPVPQPPREGLDPNAVEFDWLLDDDGFVG